MRRLMVAVAITATTVALMGGVALAGEMEVVPDSLPEPGETEFDITLTEFDPETPVFVLPCKSPESGIVDDIDGETCNINQVASAMTDADGTAMVKLIWDVPPEGVAFVAGNETRTDAASALVSVQDTRVLGDAQEDPDDTGELPDTGSETWVLVGLAAALVVGGSATSAAGRRLALA